MLSPTHFQGLLQHLAEGDLTLYGTLSVELGEVPKASRIKIGDLFVGVNTRQSVWYEALEPAKRGSLFVRSYSWAFKRGEYDRVQVAALTATVTRELFERAKANGFRTIRRAN